MHNSWSRFSGGTICSEHRQDKMSVDGILEPEPKESWMIPTKDNLQSRTLPDRKNERRELFRKAARFIMQGVLCKKGFSVPMLWYVANIEAKQVLKEVHEGACGNHTGRQTLAKKIIHYRYFWPIANRDVVDYARKYYKCNNSLRF